MSGFVTEEELDALTAEPTLGEEIDGLPPQPSVELVPVELADPPAPALSEETLALVPPETEMKALVQLAITLSAAQLVPRALKDKPNDVLLVLLTARDLGIKLTTALRLCYPIEGQVTVAPKLKLAIIRERGLGRVWPDPENDATQATWYAVRADDPETVFASSYTIEEATSAKLAGKDNWKHYPGRMLSWRALGYLMDDAFGEVGAGLYSPDELGAITDEEGHPILDVTEVGPLEGTDEPRSMAQARRRREEGPKAGDELAPQADRDRLDRMLRALPDAGLEAGKALWASAVGVKVSDLPARKLKAADALLDSIWKRAEGGEWGEGWTRPQEAPPQEGAESAGEAPGPESAEEPSEAQGSDPGGESAVPGDLPDLGDIDAVIDWTKALSEEELERWISEVEAEPEEGAADNERRRVLAVAVAGALGLL